MLKIYTNIKDFLEIDGIMSVDAYFNLNVTGEMLSNTCKKYLERYEYARLIDESGVLVGRFGAFPLTEISSGVKTLLILVLMKEKKLKKEAYINISECGDNILTEVFKYAEELQIPTILRNIELYGVSDFEFLVNDTIKVSNIIDLVDVLIDAYTKDVGE